MSLFLYFYRDSNLWMVILVGIMIYAVSMFVLRFFKRSDWDLLKAAVNIRQPVSPDSPNSPHDS